MDEKDFEILEIISETGNITKAAQHLFITQSALSKRIRTLENELGTELLIRAKQGTRLTPAGEVVLESSKTAAQELSNMRRKLTSMQDTISGTLNAGFSTNFTQYYLPDILSEYHRKYPEVRLRITTGLSRLIYRDLLEGKLDLAILRGEHDWDADKYVLTEERMYFICSEAHRDTPLPDYPYINHITDPHMTAMTALWMREQGLDPRISDIFHVDNITVCTEMVKRDLGWSLMPEIALKDFNGIRKPISFANGDALTRQTGLYLQHGLANLRHIRAFSELVRDFIDRLPHTD